jgi:hypothetical protein
MTEDTQSWPPMLNRAQMHEATESTLVWTTRTMDRMSDMMGCLTQMGQYASMLHLAGNKLLESGTSHNFDCEDRRQVLHRLYQLKASMMIAEKTMQYQRENSIAQVEQMIARCNEIDEDCLVVHFHDDEPAVAGS